MVEPLEKVVPLYYRYPYAGPALAHLGPYASSVEVAPKVIHAECPLLDNSHALHMHACTHNINIVKGMVSYCYCVHTAVSAVYSII